MGTVYGHLMSLSEASDLLFLSPWQALLFVIKDHPREVSIVTSEDAQSALYALLTTRYGISQQAGSSPSASGSVGSSAGTTAVSSQGNSSTAITTSASAAALANGGGFQVNRRLWYRN